MPWSFGFVVMLVCLLILLACGAVKMLFKRGDAAQGGKGPRQGPRRGGHCAHSGDDDG